MLDFCIFVLSSAMLYFISLVIIDYAYSKTKKTKSVLLCITLVVFSVLNGGLMVINQNKLPLEVVDKEWSKYVVYCRQEHTSWSDLTFPEWLSIKTTEN